jgi:hypothetical protein
MRQGRPIWWLVVVIAVAMSVMPWGTAQAGRIKWGGEGYAPWKVGEPDDPGGGISKRVSFEQWIAAGIRVWLGRYSAGRAIPEANTTKVVSTSGRP